MFFFNEDVSTNNLSVFLELDTLSNEGNIIFLLILYNKYIILLS